MARVIVYLTFPIECEEIVRAAAVDWKEPCDVHKSGDLYLWAYDEVKNGQLPFLKALQDQGVPFNSEWEGDFDFDKGTLYCRFTENGERILKTVYDLDFYIGIYKLNCNRDDHEKLKHLIDCANDTIHVLSWDHQVEYGKRYLANKLITL